jgi:hypothetical protein
LGAAFPTLKRETNEHCAYGAAGPDVDYVNPNTFQWLSRHSPGIAGGTVKRTSGACLRSLCHYKIAPNPAEFDRENGQVAQQLVPG